MKLKTNITNSEVRQICSQHQIEIKDLESNTGSFDKTIYFINRKYLLRVSETPMTQEQEKYTRVGTCNFIPRILHVGELANESGPIFYMILTLLPGNDFEHVFPETTLEQQCQFGQDVAEFLDSFQEISGTYYDIGLYLPALAQFSGTWRVGHQRYWEILERGLTDFTFLPESNQVFSNAFQHLRASMHALDFQTGPKLLHNDLHPRNMLLHQGQFSGVIDWECSQFGEADFDLCHLVHWCVYPPKEGINYRPFLRALFHAAPKCTRVPNLAQRLTIYQIEHEIQQTIWHGSGVESWRISRLMHWMTGGVEDLMNEIMAP